MENLKQLKKISGETAYMSLTFATYVKMFLAALELKAAGIKSEEIKLDKEGLFIK